MTSLPPPDYDTLQLIDRAFNRKYSYVRCQNDIWNVPSQLCDSPESAWSDDSLRQLKLRLNEVKSKLNDIDISEWQNHTQAMHPGGDVAKFIGQELGAELCTQAWCKFHEVLGTFPQIIQGQVKDQLNTVHLCEAPGAFVASLNHFLVNRNQRCNWRWLATTLNPSYEGNNLLAMINNDYFIEATSGNWCFGADDTGNIMDTRNINSIVQVCRQREMNCVDLVTADGSVDCANDPSEQETTVLPLIFSEIVAALCLLSPGGSMVIKMFTLFSSESVSLMFLLCCVFSEVTVYKPVTSKPGNSEVYVVTRSYLGANSQLLDELKSHVGCATVPVFRLCDLPDSFLEKHRECCSRFTGWQEEAIKCNLSHYGSIEQANIHLKRKYILQTFLEKFNVQTISEQDRLVHRKKQNRSSRTRQTANRTFTARRRYEGSFNNRKRQINCSWKEKLLNMDLFDVNNIQLLTACKGRYQLQDAEIQNWQPVIGKLLDTVHSSRFCDRWFLVRYLDLLRSDLSNLDRGVQGDTLRRILSTVIIKSMMIHPVNSLLIRNKHVISALNVASADQLDISGSHLPIRLLDDGVCDSNHLVSGAMLCGNLTFDPNTTDMQLILSMKTLIELIDVLEVMSEGCHCIMAIAPALTRLGACVLYVMFACFSDIVMYKDGTLSALYVAALGFQSFSAELKQYLKRVKNDMHSISDSGFQLVSLIPMNHLFERRFYEFLSTANNDFLRLRSNFLQELQLQRLADSSTDVAAGSDRNCAQQNSLAAQIVSEGTDELTQSSRFTL